jgi:hypothetical protein
MLTLTLQTLVGYLLVGFAAAAALVVRRTPGAGPYRESWRVTSTVFGVYAGVYALHATFAVAAYVAGPGSSTLAAYLQTAPAGNHARTFMLLALYGLLGLVALRAPVPAPPRRTLLAAALGAAVLGVVVGIAEGRIEPARHFSTTAVLDWLGFLLLGTVLILAIQRDSMDRMLWICLTLHGTCTIVGVLYYTGFAWFGSGSWTPPFWHVHLIRVMLISAQIAVVVARLRARSGTEMLGLGPGLRPRRATLA